MEERKLKQQDQMESLVRHFYEIPGKVVMLHDGEYLFHEGDTARYFYIVRSGQIFITKYAMSGRVLSLRLASRGSLIGELPLYEKDPVYIFNAVAQRSTRSSSPSCRVTSRRSRHLPSTCSRSWARTCTSSIRNSATSCSTARRARSTRRSSAWPTATARRRMAASSFPCR